MLLDVHFISLASANICSVLNDGSDESPLSNFFGPDLHVVEFRRVWEEASVGGGYAVDIVLEMANFIIHGGTFNSAQGDLRINNKDSGLHILRLGASLGVIHNSAERYPPPNRHSISRTALRTGSMENPASSSFWLYGPAGAGKTALKQSQSFFAVHPDPVRILEAAFSFPEERKGAIKAIFYSQGLPINLALKVPGLRQHVNRIVELDPTLHTKLMDVQLQTLIIDAFQYLSSHPQRSYLVIIDGLDECHDKMTQRMILRFMCETITVHKIPLRFLIGSRPESHIRKVLTRSHSFDPEFLYTVTRQVVLDEMFDPGRDIRVFLQDSFAKICAENSILSHIKQPSSPNVPPLSGVHTLSFWLGRTFFSRRRRTFPISAAALTVWT